MHRKVARSKCNVQKKYPAANATYRKVYRSKCWTRKVSRSKCNVQKNFPQQKQCTENFQAANATCRKVSHSKCWTRKVSRSKCNVQKNFPQQMQRPKKFPAANAMYKKISRSKCNVQKKFPTANAMSKKQGGEWKVLWKNAKCCSCLTKMRKWCCSAFLMQWNSCPKIFCAKWRCQVMILWVLLREGWVNTERWKDGKATGQWGWSADSEESVNHSQQTINSSCCQRSADCAVPAEWR